MNFSRWSPGQEGRGDQGATGARWSSQDGPSTPSGGSLNDPRRARARRDRAAEAKARRSRGYGIPRDRDSEADTPPPWDWEAHYSSEALGIEGSGRATNARFRETPYDDDFFLGHRRPLSDEEADTIPPQWKFRFPTKVDKKTGKKRITLPASWRGGTGGSGTPHAGGA
jgi:hypothetical protein